MLATMISIHYYTIFVWIVGKPAIGTNQLVTLSLIFRPDSCDLPLFMLPVYVQ